MLFKKEVSEYALIIIASLICSFLVLKIDFFISIYPTKTFTLLVITSIGFLIICSYFIDLLKGQFDFFEIKNLFLLMFLLLFVLKPIDFVTKGGFYLKNGAPIRLVNIALSYAFLGLVCFFVGYHCLKKLSRKIALRLPNYSHPIDKTKLNLFIVGSFILSFLSLLILSREIGGIWNWVLKLGDRERIYFEKGYQLWGLMFFPISYIMWYAYSKRKNFLSPLNFIFFCVSICFLLITGSRLYLVTLFVSLVVINYYSNSFPKYSLITSFTSLKQYLKYMIFALLVIF